MAEPIMLQALRYHLQSNGILTRLGSHFEHWAQPKTWHIAIEAHRASIIISVTRTEIKISTSSTENLITKSNEILMIPYEDPKAIEKVEEHIEYWMAER